MAEAIVNSEACIGANVIINTGARVDNDCIIEDRSLVAPGFILCGTVNVGSGSFIGAGAQIIPNISIGSRVVVGAGSTVLFDFPTDVTVVGSPARILKGMK